MSLKTERIKQPVVTGTTQPLLIGGISDSDSKLTINTDGSITATTAVTVPSLVVNSKNVASNLLAEYTVTGSAVTSIDFSGLDINTHKSYRVEATLVNALGSAYSVYLFVNGDTTVSNYYHQFIYGTGNSITTGRGNASDFTYIDGSSSSSLSGVIQRGADGYPSYYTSTSRGRSSSVQNLLYAGSKTATVSNITQITITSATASGFAVGSTIRIYRGDV